MGKKSRRVREPGLSSKGVRAEAAFWDESWDLREAARKGQVDMARVREMLADIPPSGLSPEDEADMRRKLTMIVEDEEKRELRREAEQYRNIRCAFSQYEQAWRQSRSKAPPLTELLPSTQKAVYGGWARIFGLTTANEALNGRLCRLENFNTDGKRRFAVRTFGGSPSVGRALSVSVRNLEPLDIVQAACPAKCQFFSHEFCAFLQARLDAEGHHVTVVDWTPISEDPSIDPVHLHYQGMHSQLVPKLKRTLFYVQRTSHNEAFFLAYRELCNDPPSVYETKSEEEEKAVDHKFTVPWLLYRGGSVRIAIPPASEFCCTSSCMARACSLGLGTSTTCSICQAAMAETDVPLSQLPCVHISCHICQRKYFPRSPQRGCTCPTCGEHFPNHSVVDANGSAYLIELLSWNAKQGWPTGAPTDTFVDWASTPAGREQLLPTIVTAADEALRRARERGVREAQEDAERLAHVREQVARERAQGLARVEAEEAAQREVERARSLARREAIATVRRARAELATQPVVTVVGESHRTPKERPVKERSAGEELEHRRWVEEKPARAEMFRQRQAEERATAVALAAEHEASSAREESRKRGAALEAATHIVPSEPTLSAYLSAALVVQPQSQQGATTGQSTIEDLE